MKSTEASSVLVHWTPQEIMIIRKHYPEGGAPAVQKLLAHRTLRAIQRMANISGIRHAAERWTKQEIALLKKHYPSGGCRIVRTLLPHRSEGAIRIMAVQQLNLRYLDAPTVWGPAEIELLRKHYPSEGVRGVMAHLVGRSVGAIRIMAFKLGIETVVGLANPAIERSKKYAFKRPSVCKAELKTFIGAYHKGGLTEVAKALPDLTQEDIERRLSRLRKSMPLRQKTSESRKSPIRMTDAYRDAIRQYYPSGGSKAVIGQFPELTVQFVQLNARKMGLHAPRMAGAGRIWTEAEDGLIRLHYPQVGPAGILDRLPGRTYLAVAARAFNLGIQRIQLEPMR